MHTSFLSAPAWTTYEGRTQIGDQTSPVAWAANIPFSAEHLQHGLPHNTVRSLPNGGIVISVLGPRRFDGEADFPDISEPLQVSADACVASYEGQPKSNVSVCPLDRKVGDDHVLNVLVWFGTDGPGGKPAQQQLDAANAELTRLSLP
jgi:hypothetical protein